MPSSIRYAGFYQPDILRLLQQRKAVRLPYHTETSSEDPINAQIEAEAFRGHVHNSLVDMGLSELNWVTLRRRTSAVAVARSQGQRLAAAVPARIPMLAKLSGLPSLPANAIEAGSAWSTEGDAANPPVVAEAEAAVAVAASAFVVWWDAANKTLYVGHPTLQFSAFSFSAGTYAVGYTWHKEFWDGNYMVTPGVQGGWQLIPAPITDGTAELTVTGTVTIDPAAMSGDAGAYWRRWAKTTVNSVEGYWVRFRLNATGSVLPVTPAASMPAAGNWFARFDAIQGETVTDLLGTTTTAAFQTFRLKQSPFIEGSISATAFGADTTWSEVEDLTNAGPTDRAFWFIEDALGYMIQTGDGINGAVPPPGVSVEATYRIGADTDGNVGAGTLVVNRSGTPRIASVTNPAPGAGWEAAEGSTDVSLERVKIQYPALLRTNERATTTEDYETLVTRRFITSDGRHPFARAYTVPDGVGPRSMKLWLVGPNGAVPASDDVAAAATYFNGTRVGTQIKNAVGFFNSTCVASAFSPHAVDITATIEVLRDFASSAKASAEAALAAVLTPLAIMASGDWLWWPSQTYDADTLKDVVVTAVPGRRRFVAFLVNGVESADVVLAAGKLPAAGTISVTVVIV